MLGNEEAGIEEAGNEETGIEEAVKRYGLRNRNRRNREARNDEVPGKGGGRDDKKARDGKEWYIVDAITFWLLDAGGGGGVLTCSDYTCSKGVNQLMKCSAVGEGEGRVHWNLDHLK